MPEPCPAAYVWFYCQHHDLKPWLQIFTCFNYSLTLCGIASLTVVCLTIPHQELTKRQRHETKTARKQKKNLWRNKPWFAWSFAVQVVWFVKQTVLMLVYMNQAINRNICNSRDFLWSLVRRMSCMWFRTQSKHHWQGFAGEWNRCHFHSPAVRGSCSGRWERTEPNCCSSSRLSKQLNLIRIDAVTWWQWD